MKRIINIALFALGFALLSSCSSTGSVVRGSDAYGYYDNAYYYGYPNYYQYQGYPYYQRPIIHQNIIVVPEQGKVVRSRDQVRRRQAVSPDTREKAVSPNTRRSVAPSVNQQGVGNNSSTRRSSTVAPSSRGSSTNAPAARTRPENSSRRGNN